MSDRGQTRGAPVPSLEFDKTSNHYRIRFRYAGREFKRSRSNNPRLACGMLARVEETLSLIANDRLDVPEDVDPAEFILSDGKRTQPRVTKVIWHGSPIAC